MAIYMAERLTDFKPSKVLKSYGAQSEQSNHQAISVGPCLVSRKRKLPRLFYKPQFRLHKSRRADDATEFRAGCHCESNVALNLDQEKSSFGDNSSAARRNL